MRKRGISYLLVFILSIGLFMPFGEITYAANNKKFSFTWEQNQTISKVMNIVNRKETDNELVLKWSYDKVIGGNDAYVGDYLLKYHITDNEEIELKVNNEIDGTAKINYAIKNLTTGNYKTASLKAYDEKDSKIYWVYDSLNNKWYNENNPNTIWKNGNTGNTTVPDNIFAPTGISIEMKNNGPELNIKKGSSVAFKYDNKLVVLKWDVTGEYMTLGIEGIERNRIYNFNITDNYNNSESMDIFKLAEFKTKPIGERLVSKKDNPSIYAGINPGMEVMVTIPSVWDSTVNKYVYNKYSDANYEGLNAVINLEPLQIGETIQINIPDIYTNSTPEISKSSSTKAEISNGEIKVENGKKYYSFTLTKLESSRLYTTANITMGAIKRAGATAQESNLKTKTCNLALGDYAYTYLEYDAETKGSGGRYLKIKPYNVSGSYYIYKASTVDSIKSDGTLIAKQDYIVSTDSKFIEVPVSTEGNFFYYIEFVYELGTIGSQILEDNPEKASYLITPKLEVKDYKVITETKFVDNKPNKKETLRIVLSWSGGLTETFEPLVANGKKVVYSFAKTPFSPRDNRYSDFLMLQVGSDHVLSKKANDAGEFWDTAKIIPEGLGYKTQTINRVTTDTQGEKTEIVFTVVLEFDLLNQDDLDLRDEPSKIFYYPSVYYLKMKGEYINVAGDKKETAYCNPINITLNTEANVVLPPPQDVVADTVMMKSFDIKWSTVADNVYKQYLEANNYKLEENGAKVNIFLTQKNVLSETDPKKQLAFFEEDVIYIPFANVVDSTTKDKITINLTSVIDYIRANRMVCITDVPQTAGLKTQVVTISGLDKNTIYYSALKTALDVINISDGEKHTVFSNAVSQIITITTKKEDPLLPPKPEEIAPEAPLDFREDTDIPRTATKVAFTWTDVKEPESIDGIDVTKEYELVRLDKKLDETVLNKRDSFDDFWKNSLSAFDTSQKMAWQTSSSMPKPENILTYNNSDFVLDTSKTTDKYTYDNSKTPKLNFIDETLMPNRIYYYYIRTVRMVKDTTGTYTESAWSSWIPLAITTNPVKSPTDLKVERDETYFTYDKKTEMVISFFAPIPVGMSMADIAALYPLEYSIMMDGGEWKTVVMDVTNSSLFKVGNEKKEGYQQFVYKITGLEPGKGYSIKVRMKSRVNAITESKPIYDVSLDSNTVQHRTDIDQGIIDEEDDIKKWLKLFDDEVLALSTKTYWVITNTSNSYEAIYRTLTFDGELQKATSGAYDFEAKGQPKQVYYIPASSIIKSNDAGIGFRAIKDGMEVLIRPDSFDSNTTEAIGTILDEIHDGTIKDYYIKLEFDWTTSTEKINNSDPLTEQVQIEVSAVGSQKVEKTLDTEFVNMFKKAIEDSTIQTTIRERLKRDLKVQIKKDATNEELYTLVMDAVGEVNDKLLSDIEREFDRNTKRSYIIDVLGTNMLITATIDNQSSVGAYKKNNDIWETMNISDYGGKKGFETNLLGLFVFSGKVINVPNIEGVTNSTTVKELIAKYGLDDYLGKDIIDVKAYATKYMVVGSIARMAGASNTQNEVSYLKNKGINVTSGKLYNNISNEETLYLIMSLYEIKTGTKTSTVRITNYNALPDLSNVNNNYKNAIKSSVQLGIYNDTSIGLNDNITIKTLLEYLGTLSDKI